MKKVTSVPVQATDDPGPSPLTQAKLNSSRQAKLPAYEEIITCNGVQIPFVTTIISTKIERPLRNSRYEARECAAVRRILKPGDRVLELGAGVGLLSAVAAMVPGIASVTAIEANPELIPLIRETHRLNGVSNVDLINGVAAAGPGPDVAFYLRPNFWSSSMEPDSRPYDRVVKLPMIDVPTLIADLRPTVIICDIEGGELGLFDTADLSSVRAMVLEVHPKVYGKAGMTGLLAILSAKGLSAAPDAPLTAVQLLERRRTTPAMATGKLVWPPTNPRAVLITSVRDQATRLLEWVAWHKAAGFSDILVFDEGSTDGTTELLEHLGRLGHLIHLPHPAVALPGEKSTDQALAYARHLRLLRDAEFSMAIEVCEFLNIRAANGTLRDLFAATGPFDVLSVNEVNHGPNGHAMFEPGWVSERFPKHEKTSPGRPRSQRRIRSIVRMSDQIADLGAHRPTLRMGLGQDPVTWLDGSGQLQLGLAADATTTDCRGRYGLVRLERFGTGALDSHLAGMYRDGALMVNRQTFKLGWAAQNQQEEDTGGYAAQIAAAKRWSQNHLDKDPALVALDAACADRHAARIAALQDDQVFQRRRRWVLSEAW